MSAFELQIRKVAEDYLLGRVALDHFRSEFAAIYFHVRQRGRADKEAMFLLDRLIGPLAEFSREHRSEQSLREELAKAVGPFALRYDPFVFVYEEIPKERRVATFAAVAAVAIGMYIPPTNLAPPSISSAVNIAAVLPSVGSAS